MILHVSTVTIYLLSLLIYVCGCTVSPNKYFVAVAYSLEIFCNHLIQVLICYIFWNMENIKIVPQQAAQKSADEEDAAEDEPKLLLIESTDSTL